MLVLEKQEVRKYFGSLRRFLVNPDAKAFAERLASVLPGGTSPREASPQSTLLCASYIGAKGELDPSPAVQLMPHIKWCYPRWSEGARFTKASAKGSMKFYITNEHTEWSLHRLGFREPVEQAQNEVCLHDCAAVLVPGLSFDQRGHRVGSGAGYYDRALRGERCLKVGLCYECQVSHEDLPTEEHDIAMDIVVTEKNIYRFTKGPHV